MIAGAINNLEIVDQIDLSAACRQAEKISMMEIQSPVSIVWLPLMEAVRPERPRDETAINN